MAPSRIDKACGVVSFFLGLLGAGFITLNIHPLPAFVLGWVFLFVLANAHHWVIRTTQP